MQRLYHALFGTVRIRLTGPAAEYCCSRLAQNGIPFWALRRESEQALSLTLPLARKGRALKVMEEAGCRGEVTALMGLPGLLGKVRGRYGLAVGLIGLALFFALAGQTVLVIEVEGNRELTRSEVLAALADSGLKVGSYGPAVDERELSNRMMLRLEELRFCAVNLSGIRATVILRERPPTPEVRDEREKVDIAAAREGVVLKVEDVAGRALVETGDAVEKGQVLISGLITHKLADGSGGSFGFRQIRAQGRVMAYTRRCLSAAAPLTALIPEEEQGEETRRWGLEVLGRRLNFYRNSSILDTACDKIAILYPLTLPDGSRLPFGVWSLGWRSWQQTPQRLEAERTERQLKALLEERLAGQLSDGTILSLRWTTEQRQGALYVTLEAQCLEDIGQRVRLN